MPVVPPLPNRPPPRPETGFPLWRIPNPPPPTTRSIILLILPRESGEAKVAPWLRWKVVARVRVGDAGGGVTTSAPMTYTLTKMGARWQRRRLAEIAGQLV